MHLKTSRSCTALRDSNENSDEEIDNSCSLQLPIENSDEVTHNSDLLQFPMSLKSAMVAGTDDDNSSAIDLFSNSSHDPVTGQLISEELHDARVRKKARNDFVMTSQQRAIVKLIKLLDDMNCPDYALSKILDWMNDNEWRNVSMFSASHKRETHINWMRAMLHNANCLMPNVVPTLLPTSQSSSYSVEVMCFDFVPQLLSLLQDPDKMTQANLVIDVDLPVPMHCPKPGHGISEVLDGTAYRDAYWKAVKERNARGDLRSLLVVPICCWGDATHIDQHGRFKLEPWSFSPLIFNEKARRNPDFWRVLGYVNVLKLTKAEKKRLKKGETCQMYHKQLEVIFSKMTNSLHRLKNVTLPIGPHRNLCVDIVCPLLYVIADTEGADKMCGRYICYSRSIAKRCRVCDVSEESFCDPEASFSIADSAELTKIQETGNLESCQASSVHAVNNAFRLVDMGGASNGIFTATPPDILHVVRKGLMERLVHCLLDDMSPVAKATLDRMAMHYHLTQKQRCKADYPKMSFTCGFTNLSFVQAHEWVGIVFLLVTLAQTQTGWQLLDNSLSKSGHCGVAEALNLLEAALCFDAWLHKDVFWTREDAPVEEARARESIKTLMNMCLLAFPEEWHVIKFHMLLHFPHFITKFGAPNNYDSQRPEHSHIAHAKRPGRRSQKTHSGQKFERQVAQRMADTFVIQCMHDKIIDCDAIKSPTGPHQRAPHQGTLCRIHCQQNCVNEVWKHTKVTTESDLHLQLLPGLLNFLLEHFDNQDVVTCTEMHANDVLFRCHPNYRGEGPFYDWAIFQTSPFRCRPCKIVAFLPVMDDPQLQNCFLEEAHVVVLPCARKAHLHSTLYEEWTLGSDFNMFPLSAIVRPCLTIVLDAKKVCVALDRKLWASEFS